jgi:hypothetical protein
MLLISTLFVHNSFGYFLFFLLSNCTRLADKAVGKLDLELLVDGQQAPETLNSRTGVDLPGGIKELKVVVWDFLGIGIAQPGVQEDLQVGNRRDGRLCFRIKIYQK